MLPVIFKHTSYQHTRIVINKIYAPDFEGLIVAILGIHWGQLDTWILIASWFVGCSHLLSASQFLYGIQQQPCGIGIG